MLSTTEALEKKIGIEFKNKDVLTEALTHRSYLNEYANGELPLNERLEYLGDAVLELVITHELFKKFPDQAEGQLTVLRAALVNAQMLSRIAEDIELGDFLRMSRGERKDTGKAREVILANAIEAVIGAIYIDQGIDAAKKFILKFIWTHLDEILETKSYRDSKSELQEIIQEQLRVTPTYKVMDETGPAHKKTFKVGVYFGDKFVADGVGASQQEAEVEAAKNALANYKKP